MERREWTPEEVAGEKQRAEDTELYVEGKADGRKEAFLEAARIADDQAASMRKEVEGIPVGDLTKDGMEICAQSYDRFAFMMREIAEGRMK